jgi:hypothetical protein
LREFAQTAGVDPKRTLISECCCFVTAPGVRDDDELVLPMAAAAAPLPATFTWNSYNVQVARVAVSYKF